MTKRAKTLTDMDFKLMLDHVMVESHYPERDKLIFLLSYKAGLRVAEIAGLRWKDVTNARGEVGQVITHDIDDKPVIGFVVPADIAKKGSERRVPLHNDLKDALAQEAETLCHTRGWQNQPIVTSFGGSIKPNTLQRYLSRMYASAGFYGCSSHSGRRTFITKTARRANVDGCSLRDVQQIAGHRNIETTEHYIDLSPHVGRLVNNV